MHSPAPRSPLEDPDHPAWKRWYLLVLAELAITIGLLYLFSRAFE